MKVFFFLDNLTVLGPRVDVLHHYSSIQFILGISTRMDFRDNFLSNEISHLNGVGGGKIKISYPIQCSSCKKKCIPPWVLILSTSYSQNFNLEQNLKNQPPDLDLLNNFKVPNQTKCYIQNCNEYFYHKKYLLIHLQKEHQMTCEWIYKEFSSNVEYENSFANESNQNYIHI